MFFEDTLIISRPFRSSEKQKKVIKLEEIEKIHFSFGFRMDCQLSVHLRTGKKYVSFFDFKKIQPPKQLVSICLKNGIKFSSRGGKWSF